MTVVPRHIGFARRVGPLSAAAGYLLGIPALLWRAAHWPLPHRLPTLDQLSDVLTPGRRPGTELVVKAFAAIAWVLWFQIGVAVVAEMRAQRHGRVATGGMLPAWTRPFIVRLAATFLTLVPSLGFRPAGAAPAPPPRTIVTAPTCATSPHQNALERPVRDAAVPDTTPEVPAATSQYRVHPGDNLWDIAAEKLGDPRRYHEIFELNRTRVQPDGRRLTRSGLIRPGWILELPTVSPKTANGQAPVDVPMAVPPVDVQASAIPAFAPPGLPEQQLAAGHAEPASPRRADDTTASTRDASDDSDKPHAPVGLPLLVASSVIAGLGLLRRNRRNARRRHHRFPAPPVALIGVEREVRAVARNEAPRWVAAAARHLAGALAEEGAPPPPDVLAVRAGDLGVEVLIARPWPMAAGRFVPVDDGHTWRLDPAVELDELEDLARPVPSYLTALATAGESETGAILIDLDQVGMLVVEGGMEEAEPVLGSIALELATAPWADLVDVCLVGPPKPFADLDRLERVRILTPDTAVTTLKRCAGSPGVSGLTAAAIGDIPPGPTVAIVWRDKLSGEDLDTLAALAEPHTGFVLVTADRASSTGWSLTIGDDRTALLSPLGLVLRAPTGAQTVEALAALLVDAVTEGLDVPVDRDAEEDPPSLADASEIGVAVPQGTGGVEAAEAELVGDANGFQSAGAAPLDATPGAIASSAELPEEPRPVADVRVLGPIEITWRGPAPQRPQPGELVAYLATHRHPVSGDHVRLALWPARADDDRFGERNKSTLWALTSRTRQALGKDDEGKDLLPKEAGNMLSLSPAVGCDWDRFRQLVESAGQHTDEAIEPLVRALRLIRGRPFQDVRSGYAWVELEHLDAEIDAAITDAALDLVDLALATGDLGSARHAIRQGLLGCPGSEPLLRAAMRVAHATGDQPGVERAWRDIERVTGELGFEPHQDSIDLYRSLRRQGAKA